MIGGTLGVAIIGSVYASLYRSALSHAARTAAQGSFAASHAVAAQLSGSLGQVLQARANSGFLDGLHAGCQVAAGVCLLGGVIVLALLPARPGAPLTADHQPDLAPGPVAE